MKETGVIRKIDELGRIVIPKEIRRTLGIKDGENLEIYVEKESICLQKHSVLIPFKEMVSELCNIAYDTMELSFFFMDREVVVSSYNAKFLNHKYNLKLTKLLEERIRYESTMEEKIFEDVDEVGYFSVIPLIVAGDAIGLFVLFHKSSLQDYMKKFQTFVAKLIVNKIDIL